MKNQNHNNQQKLNSLDLQYGKIPPQAIEVEEAVLGSIMLESEAYAKVATIISDDVFYKEEHRLIYNAIADMNSQNKAIDLLTVTQQLKDTDKLEEIGGPLFITKLTSQVASAAHIEHHARILFQKHVQRELIKFASQLAQNSYSEDFDETIMFYEQSTWNIDTLVSGKKTGKKLKQILETYKDVIAERRAKSNEEGISGTNTGLFDLNQVTSGWQGGNLVVLAARPAMGKTAIALNLFAKTAAIQNKSVYFFSLEMDDVKLTDRLACSYGGLNAYNVRSGKLNSGEEFALDKAISEMKKLNFTIDDDPAVDVNKIRNKARNAFRKEECDMIIIDYLQLIDNSDNRYNNRNREQEIAYISRRLKLLAKELDIPVIVLCQLNRAVENREDKKPRLSDLRESGAIEQDADIVLMPYRPEYYGTTEFEDGTSTEGIGILCVNKNREGDTGDIPFKYSRDMTIITDMSQNMDPF